MPLEHFLAQQRDIAGIVFELATDDGGYAPIYYKYPDALALLLKSTARLELDLKEFNRRQVETLDEHFNLAAIHSIQLDQFDDLGIFIDFAWDQDEDWLNQIFAANLPSDLSAGALMSQSELGFTIDYSPMDQPAQKFLERHIPKLAGDINVTTKNRVKNAVRQSLLAGEDRSGLEKRLESIFDNPARRRAIAQTESVQAFSEGRVQAGIEMGATEKRWRAQIGACPLCQSLHGVTVKITDSFPGGYSPPLHVSCRCGIELSFGAKQDTSNIEQYRADYLKSLRERF